MIKDVVLFILYLSVIVSLWDYFKERSDIGLLRSNYLVAVFSFSLCLLGLLRDNLQEDSLFFIGFISVVLCVTIVQLIISGRSANIATVHYEEAKRILSTTLSFYNYEIDEDSDEGKSIYKQGIRKIFFSNERKLYNKEVRYATITFKYMNKSEMDTIYKEFINSLYLRDLLYNKTIVWNSSELLLVIVNGVLLVFTYMMI